MNYSALTSPRLFSDNWVVCVGGCDTSSQKPKNQFNDKNQVALDVSANGKFDIYSKRIGRKEVFISKFICLILRFWVRMVLAPSSLKLPIWMSDAKWWQTFLVEKGKQMLIKSPELSLLCVHRIYWANFVFVENLAEESISIWTLECWPLIISLQ